MRDAFGAGGLAPVVIGTLGANNLSNTTEETASSLEILLNNPSTLSLGLLDPMSTGAGFDSLQLLVLEDGTEVYQSQLFTNLICATNYFTDNVLSIPGSSDDSTIELNVTSHTSGDGFAFNLEASAVEVPESSTTNVAIVGVLLLALQAVRTCRQRRNVESVS